MADGGGVLAREEAEGVSVVARVLVTFTLCVVVFSALDAVLDLPPEVALPSTVIGFLFAMLGDVAAEAEEERGR